MPVGAPCVTKKRAWFGKDERRCKSGMYTLLHRAIAAAPRHLTLFARGFHTSPPARGIFDTMRDAVASRVSSNQDVAKKKSFDIQRSFLADSPTYTLTDHQALLDKMADNAGVKGWRTMLMSDAQKSEMAEQLVDLKIVACLTPAEVAAFKPGTAAATAAIDGRAKERVAKELGTDVARVNRFLSNYTQSFAVHQWLAERRAKGLAIPVGQEEFNLCAVQDKVVLRALSRRRASPLRARPALRPLFTPFTLTPPPPPLRRREQAAGHQQGPGAAAHDGYDAQSVEGAKAGHGIELE